MTQKERQVFDANSAMSHGHQFDRPQGKEPGELSEPVDTPQADPESEAFLSQLAEQERIRANRVEGIRAVLVVISAKAMVYDVNALRQKILLTYPDAAVFFTTPLGIPVGPPVPGSVDLVIDFTGPGQRQRLFLARKLRKTGRVVVGRDAGMSRKRIYDRVFEERSRSASLPADLLDREAFVQKEVLALAGVPLWQSGDTPPDRGKITPLELPPLSRS